MRHIKNISSEVLKMEIVKHYNSTPKKNTSSKIFGLFRFGQFCKLSNATTLQDLRHIKNSTSEVWKMEIVKRYNSTPKKNTSSRIFGLFRFCKLANATTLKDMRPINNSASEVWKMEIVKCYNSTPKKNTSSRIFGLFRFGQFCKLSN